MRLLLNRSACKVTMNQVMKYDRKVTSTGNSILTILFTPFIVKILGLCGPSALFKKKISKKIINLLIDPRGGVAATLPNVESYTKRKR